MYTVVKDSHGNQKVCLSVCRCERERAVHVHDIHNVFMSSLGGGDVGALETSGDYTQAGLTELTRTLPLERSRAMNFVLLTIAPFVAA